MNLIFKCNGNTKYLAKDLKSVYTANNFSVLDLYLNEKRLSVKIHLLNIFKDHDILAYSGPAAISYDGQLLSNTLYFKYPKFQKGHGKFRPKLTEYFQLYQCLLNSAMFCTTSFFGLMWQHLNHSNLLIRSVYQLHVYFYIHMILHHLGILWYMKRILARLKKNYIKSAYYIICDNYSVNVDQIQIE